MTKETLPSPDQLRQIALEVNKLLVELITDSICSSLFENLKRDEKHLVIFSEIDGREARVIAIDGYRRVRLQHQRGDGEERTASYVLEDVATCKVGEIYRPFIIDGKILRNEGGDYAFNPISFNEDDSHPFVALILDYWGRFKRGQLTAEVLKQNIVKEYIVPETWFPRTLPPRL